MGFFLYNVLYIFLYFFYKIFIHFYPKLKKFHHSRLEGKKAIQKFFNDYQGQKKIWLHASSMGELEQALALYFVVKKINPTIPVIITVFSLSVKDLKIIPSEGKAYLPLDVIWQWNFQNFDCTVFVSFTWDVFPNLLKKLKKINCYNFLCSAAINKNSYKVRFPFLFRFLYEDLDGIGVVDQQNAESFAKFLPENKILITGDTRYDYIAYKLKNKTLDSSILEKLQLSKDIFILGSTYTKCEEEIFPYLHLLIHELPHLKIWIFPHKIDSYRLEEVKKRLKKNHLSFLILSDPEFKKKYKHYSIVVVDQLGILAFAYGFSKICYVGGAFHHRVHNTAEPAFNSSLPFTGPKIYSSPIAVQLKEKELLFDCQTGKEIVERVLHLYKNSTLLEKKRKDIKQYIFTQTGASEKFYYIFLRKFF